MSLHELNRHIDVLIKKYTNISNCYRLRLEHSSKCIRIECYDAGHSQQIQQAKKRFSDCTNILNNIIEYLTNQDIKLSRYILEEEVEINKYTTKLFQKLNTILDSLKDDEKLKEILDLKMLVENTRKRIRDKINNHTVNITNYKAELANINSLSDKIKNIFIKDEDLTRLSELELIFTY